ncbi:unnamed protein product [Boreogadus saida]
MVENAGNLTKLWSFFKRTPDMQCRASTELQVFQWTPEPRCRAPTLERMKVEHKMALEETASRHKAHSMDWFREREALKAQPRVLGLMKELEENRQVAQQLSFNVGPQPIETHQDRRGTAPPRRAAQPRRRVRDVERQDCISHFQQREEREHLIHKRNWLESASGRRPHGAPAHEQEQLCFGQYYRSGKRSYRFQGGHRPGWTNTLSSREAHCWSVGGARRLHQRVEVCGNQSPAQRPWRPRGQVVEAVYHRFTTDGANKSIGANH